MNRYLISGTQLDALMNAVSDQGSKSILNNVKEKQHVFYSYNTISDDVERIRTSIKSPQKARVCYG